METRCRGLFVIAGCILAFASPRAQAVDPSGHWEGTVMIPGQPLAFAIDVVRANGGGWIGTFTGTDVTNLPMSKVSVDGGSISFEVRSDQPFKGELSTDGRAISGQYQIDGYELSFELTRVRDARIEPPPASPSIAKELEGTWEGTLDAGGRTMRLTLIMENRADGRAAAHVVSVDEGGLTVPVVVTQDGSSVSIEQRGVAGSYAGVLNAERAEITGTFTQGSISLPLTFHRASTIRK